MYGLWEHVNAMDKLARENVSPIAHCLFVQVLVYVHLLSHV